VTKAEPSASQLLGLRRSILAIALAVCACQQGRRVRFTTLAGLANELQEAESRRELARVVSRYARIELVVLDLRRPRDYADTRSAVIADGLLVAGFVTAAPLWLSA
jgi:hypothetical protein